ncbi:hypothetical protein [Shewanella surugensis]|uniref:Uncharacterized protein n=1 Tax=Shewanella surugensis TaxID=212020 RepID=A0ABT0L5E6_9GAMM|nr:hypothetical protein [Shewanella surugensis]MCL1122909.1 hypothetical protein [Shewanella surugensis]
MYLFLIILSMLLTYIYARHQWHHKIIPQNSNDSLNTRCSYVWFHWFTYALRAQSLIMLCFGFIEIKLEEQALFGIVTQTLIGSVLFGLSFIILRANIYVWFLATLLTFNPLFWLENTLYYFEHKRLF